MLLIKVITNEIKYLLFEEFFFGICVFSLSCVRTGCVVGAFFFANVYNIIEECISNANLLK